MVMSNRSTLFLSQRRWSKSPPTSIVMSIRRGSNLPVGPLALSEGPGVFDDKLDFALRNGSSQCLVKYSNLSGSAPSCLCAVYSVEFYNCHSFLFSRSPEPYHSSLCCRTVQILEVLQKLVPTVRLEGMQEL